MAVCVAFKSTGLVPVDGVMGKDMQPDKRIIIPRNSPIFFIFPPHRHPAVVNYINQLKLFGLTSGEAQ
jgi:hypothetical protein